MIFLAAKLYKTSKPPSCIAKQRAISHTVSLARLEFIQRCKISEVRIQK